MSGSQRNHVMAAVRAIPPQIIIAGETVTVNVTPFFSDPGGDPLAYAASSSDSLTSRRLWCLGQGTPRSAGLSYASSSGRGGVSEAMCWITLQPTDSG